MQAGIYSVDMQAGTYSVDMQAGIYSVDMQAGTYSVDMQAGTYSVDMQAGTYSVDMQAGIYSVDSLRFIILYNHHIISHTAIHAHNTPNKERFVLTCSLSWVRSLVGFNSVGILV